MLLLLFSRRASKYYPTLNEILAAKWTLSEQKDITVGVVRDTDIVIPSTAKLVFYSKKT